MNTTLEQLEEWMQLPSEDEHIEFKEARTQFDSDELTKYCVALANEGGGRIIFGVTDSIPRRVVGSKAFPSPAKTKSQLLDRLGLRIDAEVVDHPDGRVVIFHVPSRPVGMPVQYRGAYWMRSGEQLRPMTPEELKQIFEEAAPDFSALPCPEATWSDLAGEAITALREIWIRKSDNERLAQLTDEQLLADAGLIMDDGVTYAAIILLGTSRALDMHLPQAEVIFEYRTDEAATRYQQRKEYREGFLLYHDDLWDTINLRNEVHQYQDGFFVRDIPSFNEAVVREGVLNAISHRDYRSQKSIFVRQDPRKLEIVSPGGFPEGVTADNILFRQSPRNRLLAEVLAKCGLVERSGQGVDLMFEKCLGEGKPRPDYTGSDEFEVHLVLRGEVQDVSFLRFLEQVAQESQTTFSALDLVVLDLINREQPIPEELTARVPILLDSGTIERKGRNRYILSRRYYTFVGKKGTYTRKRGLERKAQKALLLQHIRDNRAEGSRRQELADILPSLRSSQIRDLLQELKLEGLIHPIGRTRAARWFPGPAKRSSSPRNTSFDNNNQQ